MNLATWMIGETLSVLIAPNDTVGNTNISVWAQDPLLERDLRLKCHCPIATC